MKLDTAIIGGGVGGVYCGWRFLENPGPPPDFGVFEYSDRVGGRLLTRTLPGMPHVPAELGGMRYIPSTQPIVEGTVGALELASYKFWMGNPDPEIGANKNLFYLRDHHFRYEDVRDPSKVPYKLAFNERGMTMDELQVRVMNMLVPNAEKLSFDEWFDVEVYGKPLYQYGFWNLLSEVLTSEGFAYMRDAGGYEANVANANAVAQLPAAEYGPSTEFRALEGGFQVLPEALARPVREANRLHLNHRLVSMRRLSVGTLELRFRKTETKDWKTRDCEPVEEITVEADHVILALPRRAIELIEWSPKQDDPWLAEHLKSVMAQKALKLLLGFEYPWWRPLGLLHGVSVTDMPIRQTIYFQTEGEQDGAVPKNLSSLLLGSYNDMVSIPFWKSLEEGRPFEGRRTRWMEPNEDPVPSAEYPVTFEMIQAATRQLRKLHGLQTMPEPYTAIYHEWSADPYGGGWHAWKAGFKFNEVMKKIRRPVADQSVFICGEAYSNNQGWVEGALQTAEHVLREGFELPSPPWLGDANIGP